MAFTGSVPTGRKIAVAAAESNLKKVGLELGGKSPVLIFKSADIEQAAKWTATAIWFNSGQDCTAGSRVYIQEEVYDEFIGALKGLAAETAIGFVSFRDLVRISTDFQPEDEKTSFGPLVCRLVFGHDLKAYTRSRSPSRRRY